MVKVCDAIMGSGKTSAAIEYMRLHDDEKFIYVTPFIEETKRIRDACKDIRVLNPEKNCECKGSKVLHTLKLVEAGHNIATTHAAFMHYPQELLDEIRNKGYILILDENIESMESVDVTHDDIEILVDSKRIEEVSPGVYEWIGPEYKKGRFKDVYRIMQTRQLVALKDEDDNDEYFFWKIPVDLFLSFKDVFILTFMFEGQSIHHFLKCNEIPYQYINVEKRSEHTYLFSETEKYIPEYLKSLKDKIHIVENHKLNDVGYDYYALSANWFNKNESGVKQLKDNLYNFFRHIKHSSLNDRVWSTYQKAKDDLEGKGYASKYINFNERATNKYKNRTIGAYCVNIFMHVGQKIFYTKNGVDVNEDVYALSTMVQWIWRMAIRDGNDIYLYIPSSRMRTLLKNWINEVSGDDR